MKLKTPVLLLAIACLTMGAAAPVRMTPVKIADGVYMMQHSLGSGNTTAYYTRPERLRSFFKLFYNQLMETGY